MKGFSALDYTVVLAYLAGIAALGSSFYRRHTGAKEYFLGGRAISWLPAGISIIAADLSAITVMGSPAWSYANNLELIWPTFGYPLVAPLVILIFVPFYSRLNLYTAYEYLERRFNLGVRLVASLLFQFLRGIHVCLVIYAPSLVLSLVTGFPMWQCVLFMGGITTLYTTLGGMKAVIWTDLVQFFTVMSGIALIFSMALSSVPGGLPEAYRIAREGGRLDLVNLSLDPRELTSLWAGLVGGAVLCMAPLTTDQAILQRLFTTRSERDGKRSIILQAALVVPIALLLNLAGTALYVFYRAHPDRLSGLSSTDAIVPFFAVRELPAGVSGAIVACIFAASMSVMSAGINSLTTATTVDIYQRLFRGRESPEHYAIAGRVGTLCWGVIVTVLALFAGRLGALALAYNRASSYLSGPLLGIFLLGALTCRATGIGALAGAAAGMTAAWVVSLRTDWSFFYLGPVGLAVTFAVGYGVSWLTKPPREQQIRGFVKGFGS